MSGPVTSLTPEEMAQLAELADVIVPRYQTMPSASDIDLVSHLARTFASRPDLHETVREALLHCRGHRGEAALLHLASEQPPLLSALLQTVAGTYFMQPSVKRALRYPGQKRLHG